MTNVTRRGFLRRMAAGLGTLAGGWLLSACGAQKVPTPTSSLPPTRIPPSPTATEGVTSAPTPIASPTSAPSATASAPSVPTATPSVAYPDLVVARGGEPEELVQRALAALGGDGAVRAPR